MGGVLGCVVGVYVVVQDVDRVGENRFGDVWNVLLFKFELFEEVFHSFSDGASRAKPQADHLKVSLCILRISPLDVFDAWLVDSRLFVLHDGVQVFVGFIPYRWVDDVGLARVSWFDRQNVDAPVASILVHALHFIIAGEAFFGEQGVESVLHSMVSRDAS